MKNKIVNNEQTLYKKLCLCTIMVIMLTLLSSCAKNSENGNEDNESVEITTSDISAKKGNDPKTINNIGKLVTLQCTYHNVAVSNKSPGEGLTHLGEKERKFWIKYACDVTISYDTTQIKIKSKKDAIILKLPEPDIELGKVDYDDKDNYFVSSNDGVNSNEITAEDREVALQIAQSQLKELIKQDDTLISRSRNQAQKIIESYIEEIGKNAGKEYNITWE